MGGHVEVGLLGPVEVRVAGAPIPVNSLPQRVVLARLGLSSGRTVPAGDLLAALWSGEPPANATGNLHTYVSRLRRAVGADRIARGPGGYRLRAEVDIDRVRRLAEEAGAEADPARSAALLGEALAVAGRAARRPRRHDALHDLGDPPAALRRAYESLAEGGILVAIEPWSVDRLEDGIGDPSVRINYAVSTSLCTPCSLSQPGAYALGTQGGPTERLRLLTAAGFRDATLAADTGLNLVLAARK